MTGAERQRKLRTGSAAKPRVKAKADKIRELQARIAELEAQLEEAQAAAKKGRAR
jgi:hypothetical protein